MLFTAINGKKQVGNQAGEYLHHEAIFASGHQMVEPEVTFPPGKEFLYVPSELVNESNLPCGEVKTTCANPVSGAVDGVAHQSERLLALIDSGSTQQNNRIIEDAAIWIDFLGFYANL